MREKDSAVLRSSRERPLHIVADSKSFDPSPSFGSSNFMNITRSFTLSPFSQCICSMKSHTLPMYVLFLNFSLA